MPTDLSPEELEFFDACFDFARHGRVAELTELLDAGLPANLTNAKGDSLLILAAYHEQKELVDLLISRNADLTRVNDHGQTALDSAVFRQNEPIVRALLEAGADPSLGVQTAWGITDFFHLDDMRALLAEFHTPPAGPTV